MQAKSKKGVEAVEVVKRRLWSHGYSAKRATGADFDLLVEGEVRVLVLVKGDGRAVEKCDAYAMVEFPAIGKPAVGYARTGVAGELSSDPAGVFINSPGKGHGNKKEKGGDA